MSMYMYLQLNFDKNWTYNYVSDCGLATWFIICVHTGNDT